MALFAGDVIVVLMQRQKNRIQALETDLHAFGHSLKARCNGKNGLFNKHSWAKWISLNET